MAAQEVEKNILSILQNTKDSQFGAKIPQNNFIQMLITQ